MITLLIAMKDISLITIVVLLLGAALQGRLD